MNVNPPNHRPPATDPASTHHLPARDKVRCSPNYERSLGESCGRVPPRRLVHIHPHDWQLDRTPQPNQRKTCMHKWTLCLNSITVCVQGENMSAIKRAADSCLGKTAENEWFFKIRGAWVIWRLITVWKTNALEKLLSKTIKFRCFVCLVLNLIFWVDFTVLHH